MREKRGGDKGKEGNTIKKIQKKLSPVSLQGPNLKYSTYTYLDGMRKTTLYPNHDNRKLARDLNPCTPEY